MDGMDTHAIAQALKITEAEAYNWLSYTARPDRGVDKPPR